MVYAVPSSWWLTIPMHPTIKQLLQKTYILLVKFFYFSFISFFRLRSVADGLNHSHFLPFLLGIKFKVITTRGNAPTSPAVPFKISIVKSIGVAEILQNFQTQTPGLYKHRTWDSLLPESFTSLHLVFLENITNSDDLFCSLHWRFCFPSAQHEMAFIGYFILLYRLEYIF